MVSQSSLYGKLTIENLWIDWGPSLRYNQPFWNFEVGVPGGVPGAHPYLHNGRSGSPNSSLQVTTKTLYNLQI